MLTIKTNNVPRKLRYGYEMPAKFRADFDYIAPEDFEFHDFVEYKGQWYDFAESLAVPANTEEFKGWHSYMPDSFFSGLIFKLVDTETVIVGQYYQ